MSGNALGILERILLTKENYEAAIKMLKDRYGRGDLFINNHMINLLNIAPLKSSNNLNSFRNLLNNFKFNIRSLENSGMASET